MEKIAYLGPACSFSHDLLQQEFPQATHVPCSELHEVVESVASGATTTGVIPFYNTTRTSIEESQLELVAHRNKVFVTDVLPLDVRHFLCGFGKLEEITELRSKSVVFHQASKWIEKNLPSAARKDCPSTSAAVQSLLQDKPKEVAAIGTASAAKEYSVPVLSRDIQNKPNRTLFFVIRNERFDPQGMDYILLCLPRATLDEKAQIDKVVTERGCSISTNWAVAAANQKSSAYFFELNCRYSTLDLHSAVTTLCGQFRNVFVCGGYRSKCITRLIWSPAL